MLIPDDQEYIENIIEPYINRLEDKLKKSEDRIKVLELKIKRFKIIKGKLKLKS